MTLRATLLAATIGTAFLFTAAHAGGPVVVEEDTEVIAEAPRSDMTVPLILGLVILCAIACGSDGGPDVKPGPECKGKC